MSFKLKRTYTDIHGVQRTLIWKEDVDGLVCYRKNEDGDTVCSAASRWITEDGSVIQIPWEAWDYTGITFKEEYIYDMHPKDAAATELKKKVIANSFGDDNE